MKIAIPTDDGIHINAHFGRSKAFKIIEIQDDKVIREETRTNDFTGHALGHHHDQDHGAHPHDHQHSHSAILAALGDCTAVIANGMGQRLYDDLQQAQVQVFITKLNSISTAVEGFINNTLDNSGEACC
jgi:predicted Fe-Mo cluster-binding NifX family protein